MSRSKGEPQKQRGTVEVQSLDQTILIYAKSQPDALELESTVKKLLAAYAINVSENSRHEFTGSWFIKFRVELSPSVEQLVKDLKGVFGGKPSSSTPIPETKRSALEGFELNIKRLEAIVAICGVLIAGLEIVKTTVGGEKPAPTQIIVVSTAPPTILSAINNAEQDPAKAAGALRSVIPGTGTKTNSPTP